MKNTCAILLLASSVSLVACDGKVQFSNIDLGSKQQVVAPATPTPTNPPPTAFKKSQGDCAADSSTQVTSCLKCQIPPLPPVEPPMSQKAIQLMNIMTAVCPINNAKYGNQYKTPTLADHKAKLNRCDTVIYPDSTPDAGQNDVVQRLLNNDSWLQNKMFTGLWYQPPYSDYFETYFGIEVGQAIQLFCQQSIPNIGGTLLPSMTMSNPYGPVYSPGDPLPAMYVKANTYRDGLSTCITSSIYKPWQPTTLPTPKKCSYETISGPLADTNAESVREINSGINNGVNNDHGASPDNPIQAQISSWLAQGYTLGADMQDINLCSAIKSLDDLKNYRGNITVGAYICR